MDVLGLMALAILFWGLAGMFWSYIVTMMVFFTVGFGSCLWLFGMENINIWASVLGVLELFLMWMFWGAWRYTRIAVSLGVMIFSITAAPLALAAEAITTHFDTPAYRMAKAVWERQWVIPDAGFFDLFTNQMYRDYILAARPLEFLAYFELCVLLAWAVALVPAWLTMRDFRSGNSMQGSCYGYFDDGEYPEDAKPVRHKFPYFS